MAGGDWAEVLEKAVGSGSLYFPPQQNKRSPPETHRAYFLMMGLAPVWSIRYGRYESANK